MILRVYIAGPYTAGDGRSEQDNVSEAIYVAERITEMGLTPFVPHLYHYWDAKYPHEYLFWICQTLPWVEVCDAVYRTPGWSKGADQEVQFARRLGKPVFFTMDDLMARVNNEQERERKKYTQ